MRLQKELLAGLTIFLAAFLIGFFSEQRPLQSASQASRLEVAEEMARVVRTLQPLLHLLPPTPSFPPVFRDVSAPPQSLAMVTAWGLMQGFPDGSFQPERPVTRAEALTHFARLAEFLRQHLRHEPLLLGHLPDWFGIEATHWLAPSLSLLGGIGALSAFADRRLLPNAFLMHRELEAIGRAFIDYFGTNLLILEINADGVKIHPKGTLDKLSLAGWSFSWNGRDWAPIPEEGKISFPDRFFSGIALSLENPEYTRLQPIEITAAPSLFFLPLRKNMTRFRERMHHGLGLSEGGSERLRLQAHLASLRSRLRQRQADKAGHSKTLAEPAPLTTCSIQPRSAPPKIPTSSSLLPKRRQKPPATTARSTALDEAIERIIATPPPPGTPGGQRSQPAAPLDASLPGFINVSGIILDHNTRQGLGGATLLAGNRDFTTTPDGRFAFVWPRHQPLSLTVYAEGYEPLSWSGPSRQASDLQNLTIALRPVNCSLEGRVVDYHTGRPIPRATVKIAHSQTQSKTDGSFRFANLAPTYHLLSCLAPGYMEAAEVIFVSPQSPPREIRLRPTNLETFPSDAAFAEEYAD